MKKQLIIATFALGAIVLGTNKAQAQVAATTTANIHLADVISIEGGSVANGGVVDFRYETAADYNSTKTASVPKSLVVTSTKKFDVKVKANGENFSDGANNIPVNVLTIKSNNSSTVVGTANEIVLSNKDQVLVQGAALGSKLHLDLDYSIPEAKSTSSDILGKPAGTYTQTITYTATAL